MEKNNIIKKKTGVNIKHKSIKKNPSVPSVPSVEMGKVSNSPLSSFASNPFLPSYVKKIKSSIGKSKENREKSQRLVKEKILNLKKVSFNLNNKFDKTKNSLFFKGKSFKNKVWFLEDTQFKQFSLSNYSVLYSPEGKNIVSIPSLPSSEGWARDKEEQKKLYTSKAVKSSSNQKLEELKRFVINLKNPLTFNNQNLPSSFEGEVYLKKFVSDIGGKDFEKLFTNKKIQNLINRKYQIFADSYKIGFSERKKSDISFINIKQLPNLCAERDLSFDLASKQSFLFLTKYKKKDKEYFKNFSYYLTMPPMTSVYNKEVRKMVSVPTEVDTKNKSKSLPSVLRTGSEALSSEAKQKGYYQSKKSVIQYTFSQGSAKFEGVDKGLSSNPLNLGSKGKNLDRSKLDKKQALFIPIEIKNFPQVFLPSETKQGATLASFGRHEKVENVSCGACLYLWNLHNKVINTYTPEGNTSSKSKGNMLIPHAKVGVSKKKSFSFQISDLLPVRNARIKNLRTKKNDIMSCSAYEIGKKKATEKFNFKILNQKRPAFLPKEGMKKIDFLTTQTLLTTQFLEKAINNIKPNLEVRKVRRGGTTYQVPTILRRKRSEKLAIQWLIESAQKNKKKSSFSESLANELMQAFYKSGEARQKRNILLQLAESNRAYIRYRWW